MAYGEVQKKWKQSEMERLPSSEIQGEPGTGFEKGGRLGAFECGNCAFFDQGSYTCGEKTMMARSKEPKLANGRIRVDPDDCCEFVKRVGRTNTQK